eukprot:m.42229 g.42229  ORF g.42229 m.42229 type:complete len:59 (-) comp11526_c0_seq2:35-211(-)
MFVYDTDSFISSRWAGSLARATLCCVWLAAAYLLVRLVCSASHRPRVSTWLEDTRPSG